MGLVRLSDWITKWQRKFSVDKCEMMYVGKSVLGFMNKVMSSELNVTTQKGKFGIMTDSSIKTPTQCMAAVQKCQYLELLGKEKRTKQKM